VYGKGDTLARPGCADKISCPACLELIAQQKLEKVFGSQFDPD
jgi:pyrimidine deaminase RibD-like protein